MQMEYGPIKPAECEAYRAQKEKSRQEEIAHFQAEMAANKAELQSLVDAHGLTHANPSGGLTDACSGIHMLLPTYVGFAYMASLLAKPWSSYLHSQVHMCPRVLCMLTSAPVSG